MTRELSRPSPTTGAATVGFWLNFGPSIRYSIFSFVIYWILLRSDLYVSLFYFFQRDELSDVLYFVEGFAFVMLCCCRQAPRRVAVAILKEIRCLSKSLIKDSSSYSVIDVIDQ